MRETKPCKMGKRLLKRHWIKTDDYCWKCGALDVWQESDCTSDYYTEYSSQCHSCEEWRIGCARVHPIEG